MKRRLRGGGETYENGVPPPETFVQPDRLDKIDRVVSLRTRSVVVVLDRLEDSFNIAAVMRTCEGLGIQEIHVVNNPDYPFEPHPKVTQGCEKWLEVTKYKDFAACHAALKARGFSIYASAIRADATSLYDLRFDQKLALVFGNERTGVSDEVLSRVDGVYWIPMRGFTQSFNISVAVAMTLSRAVAWRHERAGEAGDLSAEEQAGLRERFRILSVKQRRRMYGPLPRVNVAPPAPSQQGTED
ncbi:MAG: hypothetical protein RL653_4525 [Pseudomonadota bacterium]